MTEDNGIPLQDCPLCGGKIKEPTSTDYNFAVVENLHNIARAERERAREFSYLASNVEIIRKRLLGSHIGKVEEHMTLDHLKTAFPLDHFNDEDADRHGTDIVGMVRHNGIPSGKVSVSVKHHGQWSSYFVDQLAENVANDNSDAGILVTTKFPGEALNEFMWFMPCGKGAGALLVKPEFAAAAYFAARTIAINRHLGITLTTTRTINLPLGRETN